MPNLSDRERSTLVKLLEHSLDHHIEGDYVKIHTLIRQDTARSLVDTLNWVPETEAALIGADAALHAAEVSIGALSHGIEGAIRRSVTELADSGLLTILDVALDELSDEDAEALFTQIRKNLGLPPFEAVQFADEDGEEEESEKESGVEAAPGGADFSQEAFKEALRQQFPGATVEAVDLDAEGTRDEWVKRISEDLGIPADEIEILGVTSVKRDGPVGNPVRQSLLEKLGFKPTRMAG